MSIIAAIAAGVVGLTTVALTAWSVGKDRPDFSFTSRFGKMSVKVVFERGTKAVLAQRVADAPISEQGLRRVFEGAFDTEIARFDHIVPVGVLLASMPNLRWAYVPQTWTRRDRPGVALYGQTIPGFSSQVVVTKFATTTTDGHEMRLHLTHAALKHLGLQELSERGKMSWMRENDVYPYRPEVTP